MVERNGLSPTEVLSSEFRDDTFSSSFLYYFSFVLQDRLHSSDNRVNRFDSAIYSSLFLLLPSVQWLLVASSAQSSNVRECPRKRMVSTLL